VEFPHFEVKVTVNGSIPLRDHISLPVNIPYKLSPHLVGQGRSDGECIGIYTPKISPCALIAADDVSI